MPEPSVKQCCSLHTFYVIIRVWAAGKPSAVSVDRSVSLGLGFKADFKSPFHLKHLIVERKAGTNNEGSE